MQALVQVDNPEVFLCEVYDVPLALRDFGYPALELFFRDKLPLARLLDASQFSAVFHLLVLLASWDFPPASYFYVQLPSWQLPPRQLQQLLFTG